MTDADLIRPDANARDAWESALEDAPLTRSRLRLPTSFSPYIRTARSQRLNKIQGSGWLAVGDAAMSYDPLSSECPSENILKPMNLL